MVRDVHFCYLKYKIRQYITSLSGNNVKICSLKTQSSMILDSYPHGVRNTLLEAFHYFKQTMRVSSVFY